MTSCPLGQARWRATGASWGRFSNKGRGEGQVHQSPHGVSLWSLGLGINSRCRVMVCGATQPDLWGSFGQDCSLEEHGRIRSSELTRRRAGQASPPAEIPGVKSETHRSHEAGSFRPWAETAADGGSCTSIRIMAQQHQRMNVVRRVLIAFGGGQRSYLCSPCSWNVFVSFPMACSSLSSASQALVCSFRVFAFVFGVPFKATSAN